MRFDEKWMRFFKEGILDGIHAAKYHISTGPAIMFIKKYPEEFRSTPEKLYCEAFLFGKRKAHILKGKMENLEMYKFLYANEFLIKEDGIIIFNPESR